MIETRFATLFTSRFTKSPTSDKEFDILTLSRRGGQNVLCILGA